MKFIREKDPNYLPQEWVKNYVDQLIKVAKELPENGVMQKSMMLRAEAILDMVIAYKEKAQQERSDDAGGI